MQEITTTVTNGYFVTANWGSRDETPEELAGRFFQMIDGLKRIDSVLSRWVYGRRNDLETPRDDFIQFIEKAIERDDFGVVVPNAGYWFGARSPDSQPNGHCFVVNCHAGSAINKPAANEVVFSTAYLVAPAPESVTYQIFHSALLAIVDAWEPVTVEANCRWLVQRERRDLIFRPSWMRYLCPALIEQVNPPASAIVEHLPNGGLLLSATDQTFDIDNPHHVAAAEEISAALVALGQSLKSS